MTSFPRGRSRRRVDRPSTPHVPIPNLESRWLAYSFRLVSNLLAAPPVDHVHRKDTYILHLAILHLDHHQSPVISHQPCIDQFQLTSVRSALEFDEPSDSTPRFSSTDSRIEPNTAHLFLLSPPFHGSVGRAATPSRQR